MLFPENGEKSYRRALRKLLGVLRKTVVEDLYPPLRFILEESQENYAPDAWRYVLNQVTDRIFTTIEPFKAQAAQEIAITGLQITNYNAKQFSQSLRQGLGIDLFAQNPWLRTQLESFSEQSTSLINTLTENEIEDIKQVVLRGVTNGDRFTQTAQNIQKRFEISSRHAKMIARDQTAKLNSSLARLRQEEVGIKTFIWQTSGDDRVRKSHKVLDGMECSWNDDSIYRKPGETTWRKKSSIGGAEYQPGQDFQCRCVSIPIMPVLDTED